MNESLQTLMQRLPELDASLRTADFTVSPDRWQSVYDLIYQLDREHRLPDDPLALTSLIAPLFCSNKIEQQTFYLLFRRWVGGDPKSADDAAEVLHHSTLARNQRQAYERQTRKRPLWSFIVVFLLLAALVTWYNSRPQTLTPTQPADATQTPQTIAGSQTETSQQPVPAVDPGPKPERDLQPIPPRWPSEVVQLNEQDRSDLRFIRDLLLSLPLVFLLAWLLRRWSRRQALRRFHRGLYANPLMYLKLRRNNKTLPFGWGEFSQRLKRSGNIETRKLDIEKTIDKTIHHAGLFTPVRLKRERQPAYLVLMTRANPLDHYADRANSLCDRLKEANVTVYRFEYHQDPRLCFSTGQSRKAHTLNQLARQYAGCRLILIGDGESLIDPFSGEAQRWVRQFEAWNTRVLLTPAPQPWDAREAQIAHAGFAVAPFRVNGLEAVSDWLLKPSLDAVWFQPGNEDPLPDLFALDESVWLTGTPPPDYDADATCAVLVDYLGQSGYRLLTACAAYPQLVSELTLTLDQILFPADNGAAREKRLVKLTRLPWFREGHLPEYLRRDLLDHTGEAQVECFGDAYIGIFKSVTSNLFARASKTMVGWMTNRITLSVIGMLVLSALVWFLGPLISFGGNYVTPLASVNNRLIAIIVCAGLWGFALWFNGKLSKRKTTLSWITNRYTLSMIGVMMLTGLIWFMAPLVKFGGNSVAPLEPANNRLIAIIVCAGLWGFALWFNRKLSKRKTTLSWITNRYTLSMIGIMMLTGLIWFMAPLIKFGGNNGSLLETVNSRLIVIMVCAGLWGFALWLKGKLSKQKTLRKKKQDKPRDYIRDLVRFAPPGSPMADRMFADIILRGQRDLLDDVLPRRLVKRLPGHRYRLWPVVLTSVSCVLIVAGIYISWLWAAPVLEDEMIRRMKTDNAGITVQIYADEATLALSDRLESSLTEWGFNLAPSQPLGNQVKIIAESNLNQLPGSIVQAAELLRPDLNRQFNSFPQQFDEFNSDRVIELISSQDVSPLQAGLKQNMSKTDTRLNNQDQLNALMLKSIDTWIDDIETTIRFETAGIRSSSNKAEQLLGSKKLSDKVNDSIKRTIPSSTDVESLVQAISQIIRSQLPGLILENMADLIIYLPGYENSAQVILDRLAYLSYGKNEYQLIREDGNQLKYGDSPVPVSIFLNQAIAAGGVFRDGLDNTLESQSGTVIIDKLSSGGVGPQMVVIPAGSFLMGSPASEPSREKGEGPQHKVTIKSFALGKTEVTFDEYDRFVEATKRKSPSDQKWGRGNRPVINVSWDDAIAYASWLSEQTGNTYRLPTEAEWEYAARAGTTSPFSTGDCINTDQANYNGNYDYNNCGAKTGVNLQKTLPVNELPPNPWGLQHMHGNVWEWTQDCWHGNYQGAPVNGTAWRDGEKGGCSRSVVRGGGWISRPLYLRSAIRDRYTTVEAFIYLGFRLARTL